MVFYNLADAKAKFSHVIDESGKKDVIVTRNGVPVSVVMSYEKYVKINKFLENIWDLYLLDVGDPGMINNIKIDDLINSDNQEV